MPSAPPPVDEPRPLPRFEVGPECVGCRICNHIAPGYFLLDRSVGRSFAVRQPQDEDALAACLDAADNCPVGAIGTEPQP
jgi:ferredoxin